LERYGVDAIKQQLPRDRRYFKRCGGYAHTGIILFNSTLLAADLGVSVLDFPFKILEQNGRNLPAPPTAKEITSFLAGRR
jgi:hypothetical protein